MRGLLCCLFALSALTAQPLALEGPVGLSTAGVSSWSAPGLRIDFSASPPQGLLRLGMVAQTLEADEKSRTARALAKAMAQYPPGFLGRFIDRVLVYGHLSFQGTEVGGTYADRTVLIANYGAPEGSTDAWLIECFHHEASSLILRGAQQSFPWAEWQAALPKGFRYGRGGFAAVIAGEAAESDDVRQHRDGFASQYARASFEEDFNTIAERIFTRGETFARSCRTYPQLDRKRELAIAFYRSLDPRILEPEDRVVSQEH